MRRSAWLVLTLVGILLAMPASASPTPSPSLPGWQSFTRTLSAVLGFLNAVSGKEESSASPIPTQKPGSRDELPTAPSGDNGSGIDPFGEH
jgi:hypothetical protein